MIPSFNQISKNNLTLEKISPKNKKIVLRSSSKISNSRIKAKRSFLKINPDPVPTRSHLKQTQPKVPSSQSTPKSTSFKINSSSVKTRKNSSRLFSNGSNKSLNFSASPKSNQFAADKVEYPLKPARALNVLRHELNNFEQGEILKYSQIYFVGTIKNKLTPKGEKDNFGYDDSHTDYLLVKNDHIAYRYEILSLLGKGSFGQVCECFDHKKKEKIALKIIKNKPKFHQQAAVEIKVLHSLRESDPEQKRNVIQMKNYFSFRNHVCITFELVSINLYEFLRLNNYNGISEHLIKTFARQILNALEYTRSFGIVHCDLKPENVLLVSPKKADIKLIDFGSSCFVTERLHTYIQSRFYRAPEIMLGIPYTCAIDMWSLGCILVELFTGSPLWPGECEKDQLLYIISYLGMPSEVLLRKATRKQLFFDGDALKSLTFSDGKTATVSGESIEKVMKNADKDFLDFLQKCFEWDPETRLQPTEALMHPWLLSGKPRSLSEKKGVKKTL